MQILRNRESNYKFCFGSHQRALCHVVSRFVALIEYAGPPKNISAGRSSKSASECPSDAFLFQPHPPCLEPSNNQPPDQNPTTTALFKSYYNLPLLNIGNIHRPPQKKSSKLFVPRPIHRAWNQVTTILHLFKSYPNLLLLELCNIRYPPQKNLLKLIVPSPTTNNHRPIQIFS